VSGATKEQILAFFEAHFPAAHQAGFVIDEVGDGGATLHLPTGDSHLRPGGTVSGPTMMALADTAMYVALLGRIGLVGLAVTTNLEVHFLNKPAPGVLTARCRLVKVGARLAVGLVEITDAASAEPVAVSTLTYSIPPR
jgi:uncharacterized protein (TIGR00369 family)